MKPTVDQELRDREQRYWEAIQHKDSATAMELCDDTCIVVGAQGVGQLDRSRLAEMLDRARYELTSYAIDDQQFFVRQIAEDVAILAYRVREDLVVDGTAESLEAFDASVWVRRDGEWLCALHTESLKGDPFGRSKIDRLTRVGVSLFT